MRREHPSRFPASSSNRRSVGAHGYARLQVTPCGMAILIVSMIIAGLVPETQAQIIHGQRPVLTQFLSFSSWDISGDTDLTIQEWHVPVIFKTGVAENVELAVSGALINATGDLRLVNEQISGLADSKIQLSASLMDDQVLLSGGVSLPTGQKKLSADQQELLLWLSSDYLSFPVRNPGEGMNLFGQIGTALPAGQWVFGASAAAYLSGKYEPFDNGREYQPGSRLVLNVGTERIWPANHRLTCDILMIYSTDDKLEGQAVFRDGVQFDTRVRGVVAIGKGSIEGGLRYILRGKDKQLRADADLVTDRNRRHGDDFRLHAVARMPVAPSLALWVSADAKFLAANDYPKASPFFGDAARLTGFGGGVDFDLGPRSRAGVGVRAWTGSSDRAFGLGKVDLSRIELIQRIDFTF